MLIGLYYHRTRVLAKVNCLLVSIRLKMNMQEVWRIPFLPYVIKRYLKSKYLPICSHPQEESESVNPKQLIINLSLDFELSQDKCTFSGSWWLLCCPGGQSVDIVCSLKDPTSADVLQLEGLGISTKVVPRSNGTHCCDLAIHVGE